MSRVLARYRVDLVLTPDGYVITVADRRIPVPNDGYVTELSAVRTALTIAVRTEDATSVDIERVPGSEYPHGTTASFRAVLRG